jgi:acetylornithine deacetylase
LHQIGSIPLPEDPLLGKTTLNVGVISGGRAPNVIADEARAEIMFRVVGDPANLRQAVGAASAGHVEAREVLFTPAIRMAPFDGLPTTVVAFTTDIPFFQGAWGQPFLIGPGSIHVAHTNEEHIPKKQILEAVQIYSRMVQQLLEKGTASL